MSSPGKQSPRSRSPEDARVWVHAEDDELHCQPFLGGTLCAFSRRSPTKDTPNEDALAVIPLNDKCGALAVADGVGGTRGGDQASATAIYELCASMEQVSRDASDLRKPILDAIENANREVSLLAIGAATTMAVAELRDNILRPYHVGDSEILVIGGRGKIKLQTVSHSPMGYALESGFISEGDALRHEDRHLVFNVIGIPEMRIEIGAPIELAPRDTLLVASDGLVDNMTTEEIAFVLSGLNLTDAVEDLLRTCRGRMEAPLPGQPHKPDDLSFLVWRRDEEG
ncbi:MAG: serine/threonine protein phosphatase PrpC [Gammaproteobacteria bacterium]|jgi:serine/threonine protein phosphatase PrpC